MGRRQTWRRAVAATIAGALVAAGCGDDGADGATATTPTTVGGDFCQVQPRFAEALNMALANADPDAPQHTQIGPILADLASEIDELRAAEPPDLDGVVDGWVAAMEDFATGEQPVDPAEDARGRMEAWVAENC